MKDDGEWLPRDVSVYLGGAVPGNGPERRTGKKGGSEKPPSKLKGRRQMIPFSSKNPTRRRKLVPAKDKPEGKTYRAGERKGKDRPKGRLLIG